MVSYFLFLSFLGESQQHVSKNYVDSLANVQKDYIEKSFPNFNLKDIKGNYFSDSALKGKITLINFWFKNCYPCIAEFRSLNEIFEKFHNNKFFNFITFTFEAPSTINEIIKNYSLKFPIISISHEECYRLNFNSGFPTSIIVDKHGMIAFIKTGGATDVANASRDIDTTILPKLSLLLNKN
jgi:peroxiredoxin